MRGVPGTLTFYIVNHNSASCSLSGKNRIFRAISAWPPSNRGDRFSFAIPKRNRNNPKGPVAARCAHIIKSRPASMRQAQPCYALNALTINGACLTLFALSERSDTMPPKGQKNDTRKTQGRR